MVALLELTHVSRSFPAGEGTVEVLKDINLQIQSGEMVAIVGTSGSGKSTLMNLLGCLDQPSCGTYRVTGKDTATMLPDELAQLRRSYFGFIFQRYHLLGSLSALENAATPAIYAGMSKQQRQARATELLTRLGLGQHIHHKPGQMSGGQQQRVSIARALMNGGDVILADEPTGALDSKSGQEVMAILQELNDQGHTVIIVTHDMNVAHHAKRIIELKDGRVIADTVQEASSTSFRDTSPKQKQRNRPIDRLNEAFNMAVRAILSHKLRSFLTMLGIVIGIASVVSVVALGNGAQQKILKDINALGTNTIDIYPGERGGRRTEAIRTLTLDDANLLAKQNFVSGMTPSVYRSGVLRFANQEFNSSIMGVGEQYFQVRGINIDLGHSFNVQAVEHSLAEVVIDANTRRTLLKSLADNQIIGQVIIINNMPARIVGVAEEKDATFGGSGDLRIWLPYTTVMYRLLNQTYISTITLGLKDGVSASAAESIIEKILIQRHGSKDFSILSSDTIRKTVEDATGTLTLLVSMIAVIALVVGGIGVMNIMLVSVTERTQEIGVRMAIGARRSDILQQFLIEAVLICMIGGLLGVFLVWVLSILFNHFVPAMPLVLSLFSIVGAFVCASMIGVGFGYLPARNAAKLNPVVALSRD